MESQQLMAVAILLIVFVGCVGNVTSFTIFSRPHMRSSSVNILLCTLSFVDFSLLLFAVPTFGIPNLNIWNNDATSITFYSYVLQYVYPVNLIMQTSSIYIMLTITLERWTAVCRPLLVRIWFTPKKSKLVILAIFLSAVVYNSLRFFEYTIVELDDGNVEYERFLRNHTEHNWYIVGYYTSLYILTHFLFPFSVMAILNGHVILSMWRLRKARMMLTRQQQREQSTTVMLLIVTFVFATCNTLPFVLNIAECVFPNLFLDERTMNIAYQLNDLSNVLVVLNSATTFLVYLSFSEKYRQTLTFILRHGCCATAAEYSAYSNMSRTASMRQSCYHHTTSDQKLNTSKSSDLLLKPVYTTKKPERTTSEYNARTRKMENRMERASERKRMKKFSEIISPHIGPPDITITSTSDNDSVSKDDPSICHV